MSWKQSHRSFYYRDAPDPDDQVLPANRTALLVIDVQNTYLRRPDPRRGPSPCAGSPVWR